MQKEETVLSIEFILLDSSPLKFALLAHCVEWQNRFTTLLKDMATKRLHDLIEFLKTNTVELVCSLFGIYYSPNHTVVKIAITWLNFFKSVKATYDAG